ncbi:MAG: acyl-CoA synthetase, long-chain fatty acid:CoA ligase, partial [Ilumatobacteraceae bacterium]|nr:acyl-CoA synthetase, long-chain fatty acid:CoA ligase [Ilumatobacteraceae bacterium]
RATSDAVAVVADGESWTGRELIRRSAGAADLLDAAGAPEGRPVAALLSSTPSAFALAIGAAATRRGLAPLGPKLTLAELAPIVAALDGEVIVADSASAALAEEVGRSAGRRVVIIDAVPESSRPLTFDIDPDCAAAVLHTSGTTGMPKPVAYRQDRLAARTRVNADLVGLGPGALYASASPFHHIAGIGMLFVALGSGAALLSMPRFDLDAWDALAARGATHVLIVPTMIEMLLEAGRFSLPGLQVLQYGAASIHPDTLARALDAMPGVRFVNIFGQTEGSPITCLTTDDHARAAAGRPDLLSSVGRAAPGVEVRIDHPDAEGVGEVVARAEHLFKPDDDGWLRTGDLGRLDGEGYLHLSGRRGDKIIRGGENVYPMEVENALAQHPDVAEACVFGVADRVWGEIVAVAVVPADPSAILDTAELRSFARERLASFKVPTLWEQVEALPRNTTGKVLRRELVGRHAVT